MRVRLVFHPDKYWIVQIKRWYQFRWEHENSFCGDDAYERAHFYARALKYPHTEEVK